MLMIGNSPKGFAFRSNIDSAKRRRIPPENGGSLTSIFTNDAFWRVSADTKTCVGLQRAASGTDKKGRPKPARLRLPWAVNRTLKNAVLGAAISAINQKDNVFKDYYERMVQDGMITSNARHAVSRKMLTVMWGMWKTNSRFDEKLLYLPSELSKPTASVSSR